MSIGCSQRVVLEYIVVQLCLTCNMSNIMHTSDTITIKLLSLLPYRYSSSQLVSVKCCRTLHIKKVTILILLLLLLQNFIHFIESNIPFINTFCLHSPFWGIPFTSGFGVSNYGKTLLHSRYVTIAPSGGTTASLYNLNIFDITSKPFV